MADIEDLMLLIKQFLPFAKERMGFQDPPRLFLKGDSKNAANPLGRTAFYDPQAVSITLYTTDRHPKDVMRSLSHELVHHTQNCNGKFSDAGEMGEGYAQDNPHMREMERQAYEMGNMCFRDWEDSIKQTIYFEHLQKGDYTMSTKDWKNGEIKTLLSEAWGFKMDLNQLNENQGPEELEEKFKPVDPYDITDKRKDFARFPLPGVEGHSVRQKCAAATDIARKSDDELLDMASAAVRNYDQHGSAYHRGRPLSSEEMKPGPWVVGWKNQVAHILSTPACQRLDILPHETGQGYDIAREGKDVRAAHARQDTTLESKELYEYSAAKHRTAGDTIEEELEECGEMPDEGEVVIDIAAGEEGAEVGAEVGAEDPAARVGELMDELKGLLMQLTGEGGGEEEVAVAVDEPMEERRAKGRSSARNQRGAPDPRQRPGAAMQEKRMREMVRKAIKEAMK